MTSPPSVVCLYPYQVTGHGTKRRPGSVGVVLIDDSMLWDQDVWALTDKEFRQMIEAACLHCRTHGETQPPAFPHLFQYRYPQERKKHTRDALWQRFEGVCYLCDLPVCRDNFHIEHVVPIARGGEDTYDNLNIAHPECNYRKGTKLLEELDWYTA